MAEQVDRQDRLFHGELGWNNNLINSFVVANRLMLEEVAECALWDNNAPYESNDEDELWSR